MPRSAPEEEEDEGEQRMKAGRGWCSGSDGRRQPDWLCVSKTRSSCPLRCASGHPECIAQMLGNLSLLPFKWLRPGCSNCLLMRLWEESLGKHKTKLWAWRQCGRGGYLIRITFRETVFQVRCQRGPRGRVLVHIFLSSPETPEQFIQRWTGRPKSAVLKHLLERQFGLDCSGLLLFSRRVASDSATPWTLAHQAPLPMGYSRQEYWSGLPCPPPGVFPTLGSNLHLLHCRQILYR